MMNLFLNPISFVNMMMLFNGYAMPPTPCPPSPPRQEGGGTPLDAKGSPTARTLGTQNGSQN